MIFLRPTSLGEQDFSILQHCVSLLVPLLLVSKPGWIVLFLLVLVKGELRLYQLSSGVELAHLPILALPGQWRLCGWTVGLVVPLKDPSQFDHTTPLALLIVSLLFPVNHLAWLL
jgi:hypothetical protein